MFNDSFRLYFSGILRIILSYLVLFHTELSLTIKIILVYIFDLFDCINNYTLFGEYSVKKFCRGLQYSYSDKIVDTITYFLILWYIIKTKALDQYLITLLTILLLFRLIGVCILLITGDNNYLYIFPNFFLELSIVFAFFKDYIGYNVSNTMLILFVVNIVIIFKIIMEYLHHGTKNI
jgi:hypothetical protein